MEAEPLTPLQESVARTGRRYFRLSEDAYVAFGAEIDDRRGFPKPLTERSLPTPDKCRRTEDGDILVSVETWRIEPEDEAMLVQAGNLIQELLYDEYKDFLPPTGFPEEGGV